jgi:hypothetical protein
MTERVYTVLAPGPSRCSNEQAVPLERFRLITMYGHVAR